MTEVQKEMIRAMRMQGIGYRAIAKSLNLKLNRVELYCKTNGLGGDGTFVRLNHEVWCEHNDRCRMCGKKLEQPRRGRKKKYCSGKCRTTYCRMKKAVERADETEESEHGADT